MAGRYEVSISARAVREIRGLPRQAQVVVIAALEMLASDPRAGKPLAGELSGVWSLRRGDYRVLYRVEEARGFVEVARVAHRRDAYRRR